MDSRRDLIERRKHLWDVSSEVRLREPGSKPDGLGFGIIDHFTGKLLVRQFGISECNGGHRRNNLGHIQRRKSNMSADLPIRFWSVGQFSLYVLGQR